MRERRNRKFCEEQLGMSYADCGCGGCCVLQSRCHEAFYLGNSLQNCRVEIACVVAEAVYQKSSGLHCHLLLCIEGAVNCVVRIAVVWFGLVGWLQCGGLKALQSGGGRFEVMHCLLEVLCTIDFCDGMLCSGSVVLWVLFGTARCGLCGVRLAVVHYILCIGFAVICDVV